MAGAFVWLTTVRDLRWRARRTLIATLAAALVLGLTVVLSGIVEHLHAEVRRTVRALGADGFVVETGVPGPFTSIALLPVAAAEAIAADPGIAAASPIVLLPQTLETDPVTDTYLVGYVPGELGQPPLAAGGLPLADDEAIIDRKSGLAIGTEFEAGRARFRVVGHTEGLTVLGERPTVYVTLAGAQAAFFGGQAVATAFVVKGTPAALPDGLAFVDRRAAEADLRRPLADTIDSIALFRTLLWIVAAAIVGSVLYLSALERSRDVAVLKATGTESRDLVAGMALQAVLLSLAAAAVAILVAFALAPRFPAGISLPFPLLATVPVVALAVGVIGSLAGLRRVLRVDPALAFGGP